MLYYLNLKQKNKIYFQKVVSFFLSDRATALTCILQTQLKEHLREPREKG